MRPLARPEGAGRRGGGRAWRPARRRRRRRGARTAWAWPTSGCGCWRTWSGRSGRRCSARVATGQPHEGSSYSARKDCQMALNRIDYARLKLGELCRACDQGTEQQQ
ncbi:PREDICTED: mediator of RNA polymerase II transcription subunit 11 [Gekko japonicus]|uniref:Mediator of RNA polymerase II transcription subunit 11 n=1 Tax=Gekko japonicus TaxID=146911 RepID=A0ABM1LBM6_GEKJA|nr:PREDICTED: mediator of RNA polymerase II transcription subunit 11 [Gekko japonicus]